MTQTNTYRAVILTALPVEHDTVAAHLTNVDEETHRGGDVYTRGNFATEDSTWNVLLAQFGPGSENAAALAMRAIEYFNPDVALFVGVAGGIKVVKLGDVVAATKVYGYASGKDEETFRPRPELGNSHHALIQRARAEARKQNWLQRLGDRLPEPPPRVFVAPIAAGAKVVASTRSVTYQFLRQNYGDALAVEMEGIGFLKAVHVSHPVQALVVRGISDLIDKKAEAEADAGGSQEIAARHAAAFAFEVLARFTPSYPDDQPLWTYKSRSFTTASQSEILFHLKEWKYVHKTSQMLLLGIITFQLELEQVKTIWTKTAELTITKNEAEVTLRKLESAWHRHCGRGADKIQKGCETLEKIRDNDLIEELLERLSLSHKDSIARIIFEFDENAPDPKQRVDHFLDHVTRALDHLKQNVSELLIFTDQEIIHIATKLEESDKSLS